MELSAAVTPEGRLEALSVTDPVKPDRDIMLRLSEAFCPCDRLTDDKALVNEKSGTAVTTRVISTEWLRVPETPVKVMG